jgi:hypothetical protein
MHIGQPGIQFIIGNGNAKTRRKKNQVKDKGKRPGNIGKQTPYPAERGGRRHDDQVHNGIYPGAFRRVYMEGYQGLGKHKQITGGKAVKDQRNTEYDIFRRAMNRGKDEE